MTSKFLKIVIGALSLAFLQMLVPLYPYNLSFQHTVPLFASDFILLAVLNLYFHYTVKSNYLFQTAMVYYIPGCLSILVESYLFEVTDAGLTLLGLLQGLLNGMFIFIASKYLFETHTRQEAIRGNISLNLIGRSILGILLYVILYFVAGILLQISYPELNEFYKGKIPTVETILYTQMVRGFLLVLVAFWFIHHTTLNRLKKAFLLGAIFSIVGGLAPLLAPNDLMPASIRIAHGVEVCTSNFIYGFCLVLLFSRSKHT